MALVGQVPQQTVLEPYYIQVVMGLPVEVPQPAGQGVAALGVVALVAVPLAILPAPVRLMVVVMALLV